MLDRVLFLSAMRTLLGLLGIFNDLIEKSVWDSVESLFEVCMAYFEFLNLLLASKYSTAISAGNREEPMNELSEAHMDYGLGELYVPEVSWACRGGVPAGFAFLTGFEGSESAVH